MTNSRSNVPNGCVFRDPAFMANRDAPIHRWVPWVAGYSKHFVEDAINRHAPEPGVVLDPFAGVGTTLVEADHAGHEAIGFEINPYAAFASEAKLKAHRVNLGLLQDSVERFSVFMEKGVKEGIRPKTTPPTAFRTRAPFYSPKVEQKVLLALDFIAQQELRIANIYRLAFAATMVTYSNYSYEPSLGRKATVGRPNVDDYDVAEAVSDKILQMANDAAWYRETRSKRKRKDGRIFTQSFFDGYSKIKESSVDLLITSPPYLNNYHYNRNTRPHLYWLGFCSTPNDMKYLENLNFGTYWQNARDCDQIELDPSIKDRAIRKTIAEVCRKNPDKGVYGGKGWANYATHYLNDCVRFAKGAAWCLRPGSTALVVLGNSVLQGVPVPTDQFLAKIAESHGFKVIDIHIPRDTRVGSSILNSSVRANKTNKVSLYEAIVELRCT